MTGNLVTYQLDKRTSIILNFIIVGAVLYFCGGLIFDMVRDVFYPIAYPEEAQFYKTNILSTKDEKNLFLIINRGTEIVSSRLVGKESFFEDIIPLDSRDDPIVNHSDEKLKIRSVRYKKGSLNLDISYDSFIKERIGKEKWNHALITFFDDGKYPTTHDGYNDQIGYNTVKILWNKKIYEHALHLVFVQKEDIQYQYGKHGRGGGAGIAKKYYFTSSKDPKIHVNFITEVIAADKVKSSSDYPKFFASIEIYKEDDEKDQILADDRLKKEQVEQQRQDEEKRKQQERKAEALKQLGIQE
ncbi:hypothetical protein [Commensalibacter communis]|uniref:hypothetical protein n=1 Tax=Commensalibacter communis TaxID=2972786 RepID=UPI0022FF6C4B|nr:hypothetical protein [Commensalibacter communis]CAI3945475.1 unnamed protein product [Commensalibacter communis]CAI3945658.1 unnamed protein product [Commensalibacter communis]